MKITKKICSALLTVSIAMSFTGCKALGKVANLDMPNNEEQFVERLKKAGINYDEECFDTFENKAVYEVDNIKYGVVWYDSADEAEESYDEYIETLEKRCNIKSSVAIGGHSKFTGSNNNEYHVVYLDSDIIVVCEGLKDKKDEISKVMSTLVGEK